MRALLMVVPLVLAACTPRGADDSANQVVTPPPPAAAPVTPGVIPATSPDARQARATVERYFAMIRAKDYAGAYKLWGDKGAKSGGSLAAFAKTFDAYSVYEPKTGEPSEIHVRDGIHYILVTGSIHVKNKRTGATADRTGTVMLSRSANRAIADPDQRDWRIWGIDIRARS